jgi:uracil-DNA glycosylase
MRRFGGPAKALPHDPRPVCVASSSAPVLIAGQAPGTTGACQWPAFHRSVGRQAEANGSGVDEAQFYDPANFAIVPMGFCFPGLDAKGGDLPPRRECAPAWRARLMAAMPQVKLILAIGQYAQAWHLGRCSGTA